MHITVACECATSLLLSVPAETLRAWPRTPSNGWLPYADRCAALVCWRQVGADLSTQSVTALRDGGDGGQLCWSSLTCMSIRPGAIRTQG